MSYRFLTRVPRPSEDDKDLKRVSKTEPILPEPINTTEHIENAISEVASQTLKDLPNESDLTRGFAEFPYYEEPVSDIQKDEGEALPPDVPEPEEERAGGETESSDVKETETSIAPGSKEGEEGVYQSDISEDEPGVTPTKSQSLTRDIRDLAMLQGSSQQPMTPEYSQDEPLMAKLPEAPTDTTSVEETDPMRGQKGEESPLQGFDEDIPFNFEELGPSEILEEFGVQEQEEKMQQMRREIDASVAINDITSIEADKSVGFRRCLPWNSTSGNLGVSANRTEKILEDAIQRLVMNYSYFGRSYKKRWDIWKGIKLFMAFELANVWGKIKGTPAIKPDEQYEIFWYISDSYVYDMYAIDETTEASNDPRRVSIWKNMVKFAIAGLEGDDPQRSKALAVDKFMKIWIRLVANRSDDPTDILPKEGLTQAEINDEINTIKTRGWGLETDDLRYSVNEYSGLRSMTYEDEQYIGSQFLSDYYGFLRDYGSKEGDPNYGKGLFLNPFDCLYFVIAGIPDLTEDPDSFDNKGIRVVLYNFRRKAGDGESNASGFRFWEDKRWTIKFSIPSGEAAKSLLRPTSHDLVKMREVENPDPKSNRVLLVSSKGLGKTVRFFSPYNEKRGNSFITQFEHGFDMTEALLTVFMYGDDNNRSSEEDFTLTSVFFDMVVDMCISNISIADNMDGMFYITWLDFIEINSGGYIPRSKGDTKYQRRKSIKRALQAKKGRSNVSLLEGDDVSLSQSGYISKPYSFKVFSSWKFAVMDKIIPDYNRLAKTRQLLICIKSLLARSFGNAKFEKNLAKWVLQNLVSNYSDRDYMREGFNIYRGAIKNIIDVWVESAEKDVDESIKDIVVRLENYTTGVRYYDTIFYGNKSPSVFSHWFPVIQNTRFFLPWKDNIFFVTRKDSGDDTSENTGEFTVNTKWDTLDVQDFYIHFHVSLSNLVDYLYDSYSFLKSKRNVTVEHPDMLAEFPFLLVETPYELRQHRWKRWIKQVLGVVERFSDSSGIGLTSYYYSATDQMINLMKELHNQLKGLDIHTPPSGISLPFVESSPVQIQSPFPITAPASSSENEIVVEGEVGNTLVSSPTHSPIRTPNFDIVDDTVLVPPAEEQQENPAVQPPEIRTPSPGHTSPIVERRGITTEERSSGGGIVSNYIKPGTFLLMNYLMLSVSTVFFLQNTANNSLSEFKKSYIKHFGSTFEEQPFPIIVPSEQLLIKSPLKNARNYYRWLCELKWLQPGSSLRRDIRKVL